MSVVKYKFGWWDTEEGDFTYHRKHDKTKERRSWKHEVKQEIEDMEQDDNE